jgi:DNA-binding beta-propeller fold protein YncE
LAGPHTKTHELPWWAAPRGHLTVRALSLLGASLLVAVLSLGAPAHPCRAAEEPVIDSALALGLANGGLDFSGMQGIALDLEHGEVVVANTGHHRVEFFDLKTYPTGYFVHRVPDPVTRQLRDGNPMYVAVSRDGDIVISDILVPYIDVVDYRGRTVTQLRLPAPDDTTIGGHGPGALTVGPDGSLWVASRGTEGRIYHFDADYRLVGTWGTPGGDPGQLQAVTALAVMPDGGLAVACQRTKLAIQFFDAQGGYIRGFGVHDIGPGNFSFPSGIAVMADGRMWVSDMIRQSVQVFDSTGKFLGAVGGRGVGPGEFINPSALVGDGKGLLALAENAGARFQLMWVR